MENKIKTGGPAFPVFIAAGHADRKQLAEACRDVAGLTVRDYFAANALQGFLAAHQDPEVSMPTFESAARSAFYYADAMLAAREGEV